MKQRFFGSGSSPVAHNAYVPVSEGGHYLNITLGKNTSSIMRSDPKLIGFSLAKHKFVGKMFEGFERVLEVGCMDGMGSAFVAQFVGKLTSIDFFCEHIDEARRHLAPHLNNVDFLGADFLDGGFSGFDGLFALDVLEHVDPVQQDRFMRTVVSALKPAGVFIVGMPSLESQAYASPANRRSHINCQTSDQLTASMRQYFHNVFSFGMNDEVIHTGFGPMCHYLLKVCAGPR